MYGCWNIAMLYEENLVDNLLCKELLIGKLMEFSLMSFAM